MGKSVITRKEIGLLFLSSYDLWTGGIIYILNIIRALNLLEDEKKPKISIFYGFESPIEDVNKIEYPYIKLFQVNSQTRIIKMIYKIKRIVTGKSPFFNVLPDAVYPYNDYVFLGKVPIHWIPDFQEWYLPQMFSTEEIKRRKTAQLAIASNKGIVVFSSQNAMNDFKEFFPGYVCELRMLRFASILPEYKHLTMDGLMSKYEIKGNYFMCPNQFWKHKNHIVVLEALNLLKGSGLDFQIVFTGSPTDKRNKDHYQTLENYIKENGIERWIKFLGFIDRADQLALMNYSQGIIQPSLFEGWSTVVEDSKAMNQFIILSKIGVHEEQATENCWFFDPHSPTQLASLIKQYVEGPPIKKFVDYNLDIRNFSENILNVINVNS